MLFRIEGDVDISGTVNVERSLERICRRLDDEVAENVARDGDYISFSVGMFRPVSTANILTTIDEGYFDVRRKPRGVVVNFGCSFRTIMAISTPLILVFVFLVGGSVGAALAWRGVVALGTVCLYWLFTRLWSRHSMARIARESMLPSNK